MKILIIKLSSIGDIFHVLPTVNAIKSGLNAEIDWVTQREYVSLVSCFSDVSNVFSVDRRRFVRSIPALRKALRGRHYDMVIDLQGLMKSAIVALQADSKRRIGPSCRREGAGIFYTEAPQKRRQRIHAVDETMDILPLLGLEPPQTPQWNVDFPAASLPPGKPRIGLLPVSRWKSKNWPVEYYAELAQLIRQKIPEAQFFMLGSESDKSICDSIAEKLNFDVTNLCGRCSLPETGGVMDALDLLIAGDSGPTHMAVAKETPCLVIYGPTIPGRTGPYGDMHRVLEQAMQCRPCRNRDCKGSHACIRSISPQQALSEALEMI